MTKPERTRPRLTGKESRAMRSEAMRSEDSGLNRPDPNQGEMSAEALAQLGDGQIAYMKVIRSEDVHALFPAGAGDRAGARIVHAARGRRHPDHADRQPRSGDRQCAEPRARNGERALKRDASAAADQWGSRRRRRGPYLICSITLGRIRRPRRTASPARRTALPRPARRAACGRWRGHAAAARRARAL